MSTVYSHFFKATKIDLDNLILFRDFISNLEDKNLSFLLPSNIDKAKQDFTKDKLIDFLKLNERL